MMPDRRMPPAPSPPSGTYARVESLGEQLDRVLHKLDGIDARVRESELITREALVGLRLEVSHIRDLLDRASRDHADLRLEVRSAAGRLDKLEDDAAEQRGGRLAAAGAGLGGGAAVGILAEVIRRMVGAG